MKLYKLMAPDGKLYESPTPGTFGGHRGQKGYGRMDCRSALLWIAKGYYVKHRVFFADETTAIAAGYRPCATCMKDRYRIRKQAVACTSTRAQALKVYKKMIGL